MEHYHREVVKIQGLCICYACCVDSFFLMGGAVCDAKAVARWHDFDREERMNAP